MTDKGSAGRVVTGVALIAIVYIASFLLVGLWSGGERAPAQGLAPDRAAPSAHFTGSASCAGCHAAEHRDWSGSHHAAAMMEATEANVLGRFDGAKFEKDGVETTFFRDRGKFFVRTDGPDGKLSDFEIKYTFGITPLQQYLIELPGGRLQAFGIAWDARPVGDGGQRWYHLYPDRKLSAGDPLHWTGLDQNWNYQCASCHSTDLRKNYDRTTRSFKTEWSEMSVGCEACHGPASRHIAWAGAAPQSTEKADPAKGFDVSFKDRAGASWTFGPTGQAHRSAPRAHGTEVLVCAACHARRGQFSEKPSEMLKFFDAFRAARIEAPLYHADGQQRDEVFNHGSFVQSRMHAAGVTCSDCHNPHSGKLRQSGNAVCATCHAPDRFDATSHHHHPVGSAGSQCASCHMPTTVYMGIDARHDHSMRIPRPDRTHTLGTPNACTQCHNDKSAQWAADAIKAWSPAPKLGAQTFAEAFDLGDRGAPGAQSALIRVAEDDTLSGLVRASAVTRLARYPSRRVDGVIEWMLAVNDPEIRSAAIAALSRATAPRRQALLVPLLSAETRLVRMDAARELAGDGEQGLSPENRRLFELALQEYVDAQLFNAERPEALANLGSLYLRRGLIGEARAAFSEAMTVDPTFYPAAVSLAELERSAGNEQASAAVLTQALQKNAGSPPLLHALGLHLVRQRRYDEALEKLSDAARRAPEDARFSYVHAVALHGSGRRQEALQTLKAALTCHPYDRDILLGLMSYELEVQDITSALQRAELLLLLEPERADIRQFVERLKSGRR